MSLLEIKNVNIAMPFCHICRLALHLPIAKCSRKGGKSKQ